MISAQSEIDYMQAANQRVAADTGLLEKRATVTLTNGFAGVQLPDEVVSVEAVYSGSRALTLIPTVEYMRLVTGTPVTITDVAFNSFFVVIARSLYIWPMQIQPATVGVSVPDITTLTTSPQLPSSPTLTTGTTIAPPVVDAPGHPPGVPLTLYYTYRPAPLTSDTMFELTGNAKRLIERLASAYILFDDGQPELGQAELVAYQKDAQRLKHRNSTAWGTGGQLALAGRRRAPG